MGEGSLSQDEIDALLAGADDTPFADPGSGGGGGSTIVPPMSPVDKELLADIYNSAFQMGSGTLSSLLSKQSRFSPIDVQVKKPAELTRSLGNNNAYVSAKFLSQEVSGKFTLLMPADDASKLASVFMGGMAKGDVASRMKDLKSCMEPVLNTANSVIQQKLGIILPVSSYDANIAASSNDIPMPEGNQIVQMIFNLEVDGLPTFKMNVFLSLPTAENILALTRKHQVTQQQAQEVHNMGGGGINIQHNPAASAYSGMSQAQQVPIKGVGFPSLSTAGAPQQGGNLNLLMDVQMSLTVELGRTKMYIKDILGLGEGSIIELDKLAGEPVDLLVNGKLIAKGEVVVIDENFGVRVTDIVSPTDRLKTEGK
ncbi:MAG: flagellar motor switch protein FliN [Leptospiraceae bacterium]|nr:flagellar motor switch protein FliN [Leptospiraceae bacterium]